MDKYIEFCSLLCLFRSTQLQLGHIINFTFRGHWINMTIRSTTIQSVCRKKWSNCPYLNIHFLDVQKYTFLFAHFALVAIFKVSRHGEPGASGDIIIPLFVPRSCFSYKELCTLCKEKKPIRCWNNGDIATLCWGLATWTVFTNFRRFGKPVLVSVAMTNF